jgi:hypothetical protein
MPISAITSTTGGFSTPGSFYLVSLAGHERQESPGHPASGAVLDACEEDFSLPGQWTSPPRESAVSAE